MQNTINKAHVEGYVFSHKLRENVSSKTGVAFITGDLNIATDESFTNIVPVNFFVNEITKKGTKNTTFELLKGIIDGTYKTAEAAGADAVKVRIDGAVDVNDFVANDGTMASPKRVKGSFAHAENVVHGDANFDMDVVLTSVIEHSPENGEDYLELKGCTFNYKQDVVPVSVNVRSNGGINYFLGCDISPKTPLFTEVKGQIVSQSIEREIEEESAFGDPIVKKVFSNLRTWDVTWARVEPYEWNDSATITTKEMKQKMADRETYLATVRQRHDDYVAKRDGGQSFAQSTSAPAPAAAATNDDNNDETFDF